MYFLKVKDLKLINFRNYENIDLELNNKINVFVGKNAQGKTIMYSRLLEGQFFNYRDIIRNEHNTSFIVNKDEFRNSLERASLLAKEEKANLVKLSITDNKVIIRSNSEIGNVHEEVEGTQDGEDLNIAFNSRYILEGIKTIESDNIKLNFMGSLNPCIIDGLDDPNYTYLVLPVRLAKDDF